MRGLRVAAAVLSGVLGALALLVSAAVTIARVVGSSSQRWVELVAFTPLALVGHVVAGLLLVAAAALAWGTPRRVLGTLAVVAGVGTGMHVAWLAPLYVADRAPPAGPTITVLDANLYYGEADGASLVRAVRSSGADLLVLTEAAPANVEALERAGVADRLRYRAGVPLRGVAGTVVLSRYPLSDVRRLPLQLRAYEMTVAAPGGPLTLFAVHPSSPVESITDWIGDHHTLLRAASGARGPAMVVGDLNATTDHRPLQRLADAGFADAADSSGAGWTPSWPAEGHQALGGWDLPPLLVLDHVLLGPALAADDVHTLGLDGTDHRALVADVGPAAGGG